MRFLEIEQRDNLAGAHYVVSCTQIAVQNRPAVREPVAVLKQPAKPPVEHWYRLQAVPPRDLVPALDDLEAGLTVSAQAVRRKFDRSGVESRCDRHQLPRSRPSRLVIFEESIGSPLGGDLP